MFKPTFWVVTQPLGQNNPIAAFVHILPSAGLYLAQHFLECINRWLHLKMKWKIYCIYFPNTSSRFYCKQSCTLPFYIDFTCEWLVKLASSEAKTLFILTQNDLSWSRIRSEQQADAVPRSIIYWVRFCLKNRDCICSLNIRVSIARGGSGQRLAVGTVNVWETREAGISLTCHVW